MAKPPQHTYLAYDRATGAVVGAHSATDISGVPQPVSLRKARSHLRDVIDVEHRQTSVLEVELPKGVQPFEVVVDPKTKEITRKAQLKITPSRPQLEGDGEDSIQLRVSARGFTGEVIVETSRGRLSERGGRLQLSDGRGAIRLVSVHETVRHVVITVSDPLGRLLPGSTEVEFL